MKVLERPDVDLVTGAVADGGHRAAHQPRQPALHGGHPDRNLPFPALLYSKLGAQHCPGCGRPLAAQTQAAHPWSQVGAAIRPPPGPSAGAQGAGPQRIPPESSSSAPRRRGSASARIDGTLHAADPGMALSRYTRHNHRAGHRKASGPGPRRRRSSPAAWRRATAISAWSTAAAAKRFSACTGVCPGWRHRAGSPLDPRLFSFNSRPTGRLPRPAGAAAVTVADEERRSAGGLPGVPDVRRQPPEAAGAGRPNRRPLHLAHLMQLCRRRRAGVVRGFRFPAHQKPVAGARGLRDPDPAGAPKPARGLALPFRSAAAADTLSGGEAQRVRLPPQLGSNLTGVWLHPG